jgi:putative transposase
LDVKKRFSEEQIIRFLKEADQGLPVKELCRKRGFSEAGFYLWRSKYGGMSVSDAKRLQWSRHRHGVVTGGHGQRPHDRRVLRAR